MGTEAPQRPALVALGLALYGSASKPTGCAGRRFAVPRLVHMRNAAQAARPPVPATQVKLQQQLLPCNNTQKRG